MSTGRKPSLPAVPPAVPPYYGCEEIANTAAGFMIDRFSSSSTNANNPVQSEAEVQRDLARFVAFAIYRGQLEDRIVYGALFFLAKYAARLDRAPPGRVPSPYALFITACKLCSCTMIGEADSYDDRCWSTLAHGTFSAAEIARLSSEFRAVFNNNLAFRHADLDWFVQYSLAPYHR